MKRFLNIQVFSGFLAIFFLVWTLGLSYPVISHAAKKKGIIRETSPDGSLERRIALVIGNGDYKEAPLKNPVNDANDMADVLADLGFQVIKRINANRAQMRKAVREFADLIKRGGMGLFYYSGHGVQIDGTNYLVPIGADVKFKFEADDQCLKAQYVLAAMAEADNGLNIIILDACRNNPFLGYKSMWKGLAKMDATTGSIVAFSTAPGTVSSDGPGRNGLYTAYLLKHIRTPGLGLLEFFNRVGHDVMAASGDTQVPWVNHTPLKPFSFYAAPPPPGSSSGTLRITTDPVGAEVRVDGRSHGPSPVLVPDLPDRSHVEVCGIKPEYRQVCQRVLIRGGQEVTVSLILDPVMKSGILNILSNPGGAKWYLDGAYAGKTPDKLADVREGSHQVEVKKEGYKDWHKTVEVNAGQTTTIEAELMKTVVPTVTNSLGMKFVLIPPGSFMMGSQLLAEEVAEEFGGKAKWFEDEHPRHRVTITNPFYIQTTEVTVGQWRKFTKATGYKTEAEREGWANGMTESGWSKKDGLYWDNPGFNQTNDHPVTCVSWNDVQEFIEWLNDWENAETYRLPYEAEWEYAARCNKRTIFFWGNNPDKACEYANIADRATKRQYKEWIIFNCDDGYVNPSPVGAFKPNDFNLYDMIGNVWEWCQDIYSDKAYGEHQLTDPIYKGPGSTRVLRGGCWYRGPRYCRLAHRSGYEPSYRDNDVGFRLVMYK